jgi:uncharacterized protein (UPF0212 family)
MLGQIGGKEEAMVQVTVRTCPKCATPLDEEGACVTCAAEAEGLALMARSGYAQIREMQTLLEEQGIGAEIEKVPPASKEEAPHARWNLYAPAGQVEAAVAFLRKDWAALLDDPAAAAAAARGATAVDLDAGGEIDCPACGHRFTATAAAADCPECGLSLGVGGDPVPGEAEAEAGAAAEAGQRGRP